MSEFKQPYLLNPVRYFVQIFRTFQTYHLLSNDRRMNVEIMQVSKIALSRSGLFDNRQVCEMNGIVVTWAYWHDDYNRELTYFCFEVKYF